MSDLTPSCAHMTQSQKFDELLFPILLTTQIWHPPTANYLAL
jgi:hypothetical protein